MILRARIGFLLLVVLAMVLAACATDDGGVETQDVVSQIPWTAPEELRYRLTDDDGDRIGNAALSVEREGDAFALTQLFEDDEGNRDDSTVIADAVALKPRTMRRQIIDEEQDRRVVAEAEYTKDEDGRDIVRITARNYSPADDVEPDSERSNPLRVPEHSYDNHSSLFLWRTIPFEDGYTASYTTVYSNSRETGVLTLHVRGQERVRTPAGEFDAWLLEIDDGNETQQAWYATTDDHRLLVYDNKNDQVLLYEGE